MVPIQRRIKRLVEAVTRTHIYRRLPRGVKVRDDIRYQLPKLKIEVVFDVGANVGQSARDFAAWFPRAQIYSFEPVAETFAELQAAVNGHSRIHAFQLALGAASGNGRMVHEGTVESFYLMESAKTPPAVAQACVENVQITTLDEFCRRRKLKRISYLKIDTEGCDLDVLKGAAELLGAQRVDLVQVEAGMNCRNTRHVPFETLKAFLEDKRYFLFGVYEQVYEWPTGAPNLRRSNCLFISEPVIRANTVCAPRAEGGGS